MLSKSYLGLTVRAVFLVCALSIIGVSWNVVQARAEAADAEIVAMVNELKAAWEKLDLASLERLFDLGYDMEYYPAEMMRVGGGGGVRAYFKEAVDHLTSVKLTINKIKVDSLGDVAYAAFLWHFEYKWDGTAGAGDGRSTLVLRKRGGKWKIIHYHESVPVK